MAARLGILALVLLLGGCAPGPGGSPSASAAGGAELPQLAKVGLQRDRAVQASIGQAGGSIDATGANGATYRLEIPEHALGSATTITVAPIDRIDGVHEKAGVAAGVHLLPDGQRFLLPVVLTITLPSAPAGGVVGYAYRGDAAEHGLYPVQQEGNTLTMRLLHFSGYAALVSTAAGASAASMGLKPPEPGSLTTGTDAALGQIALGLNQLTTDEMSAQTMVDSALADWLDDVIRPAVAGLRAVTTFDASGPYADKSTDVQADLIAFAYALELLAWANLAPTLQSSMETELRALSVAAATHGIDVANTACTTADVLERATWAMKWLFWGSIRMEINEPTLSDNVIAELCLKLLFDPQGGARYPELHPGDTGLLELHLGYTAIDWTNASAPVEAAPVFDVPFDIEITPTGTTPAEVFEGATSADGRLTREYQWVPDETELRLEIEGCLGDTPRTEWLRILCVETTVERSVDTGETGATAHTNADLDAQLGCEWLQALLCQEWDDLEMAEGSGFWLPERIDRCETADAMQMCVTAEFKVDEERLADGTLRSATVSGMFTAKVRGGGVANAGAEYDLDLEDVVGLVKLSGSITAQVTGVPDESEGSAHSNAQVRIEVECEDDFENLFDRSAGGAYPASDGDTANPMETFDAGEDGKCDISIDIDTSAASNHAPAAGQTATATLRFTITIEAAGSGSDVTPD